MREGEADGSPIPCSWLADFGNNVGFSGRFAGGERDVAGRVLIIIGMLEQRSHVSVANLPDSSVEVNGSIDRFELQRKQIFFF